MSLLKANPGLPAIRDFDRVFNRFFTEPFGAGPLTRGFEGVWQPALDLSESEKEYLVKLEAPGMAREDFEVQLDGTLLTLSGKREMQRQGKGEEYLWVEREEGRFMRTVRLPGAVQEGKIEALYHDGILTVRMPKAEPPVKNRIAIK
jgi:HSP20 family protein